MAKIIELILTETTKGTGKPNDVYRRCPQLWTKEGDLVLEFDPCGENTINSNYL